MFRVFLLSSCFLFFASFADARPVSYPGGWTIMTENNGDENFALVHYTLDPKTAVGYRIEYDRNVDDTLHAVQMNNLLKRWNEPDAQANIYLKSGAGIVDKHDGTTGEAFTGLQADWENRRFMTMYENRVSVSGEGERQKFIQSFGVGVAPYVAEFGSLHTWIMPMVMHEPEDKHNWQFAPMVRLFKGVSLIEAGYNITNKSPVANAIIRF